MNRDEAKTILLRYRPGTADADDPEIATALALARQDPELTQLAGRSIARGRRRCGPGSGKSPHPPD